MTWSGAWSNLTHAVGCTTMTFSPDPVVARRQLCGSNAVPGARSDGSAAFPGARSDG